MSGYDDWAVAFAETGSAIEQHILVGDEGIAVKAHGSNIVNLFFGRAIERFDVGKDVIEFHAGKTHFSRGQRVKHESIIAVRGVREL